MKKIMLLLCFCFAFSACETDFEVISDWKEIPIVYGVLDQSQSVQYIKINKAFLGEVDALEAAQVADSLYFPESMSVRLKSFRFTGNVTPNNYNVNTEVDFVNNDLLERVTLESEGIEKEEGTFANDPAYVYKYTRELNEEYGYLLEFTTPQGNVVKAYTPIVEEFNIIKPSEDQQFDLEITSNKTDWEVRWNNAENAAIFDITMKFDYYEAPTSNIDDKTFKTIYYTPIRNFDVVTNSINSNYYSRLISKDAFYAYLNSVIEEDASLVRVISDIEFIIYGASEEMKNYINANAAQTGINAGQVKPEYSNIDGGIGLFTTRYQKSLNVASFSNLDEWACEYELINELNFAPSTGNTGWPFCN